MQSKELYTIYSKIIKQQKPYTELTPQEKDNLTKLLKFFNNYDHIKPKYYFSASKTIEDISLDYFLTKKALYRYSDFMLYLRKLDCDSDYQINFIKDSLRFIAMFCIKNKINLEDYITYDNGYNYCWLKHIKEYRVNIYSLFVFNKLFKIIDEIPQDEADIYLKDIYQNLHLYKMNFLKSKKAKYVVEEGIKKINIFMKNS